MQSYYQRNLSLGIDGNQSEKCKKISCFIREISTWFFFFFQHQQMTFRYGFHTKQCDWSKLKCVVFSSLIHVTWICSQWYTTTMMLQNLQIWGLSLFKIILIYLFGWVLVGFFLLYTFENCKWNWYMCFNA